MESETEADYSTDEYQPSDIKAEADDFVTEHSNDDWQMLYEYTLLDEQSARQMEHAGDKLYFCTQCEKCFSSQRALTNHENIHSNKYECTDCGKCWRSSCDLARHRRSHSGEKRFE